MMPIAVAALAALIYVLYARAFAPRRGLDGLNVLYAHRGLWNEHTPENSVAAFRAAAEAGFGVELDARLSADGQAFVLHDASPERVCPGAEKGRQACAYTLQQLQSLSLQGTKERIPTLAQALDAVDGRTPLIIELKAGPEGTALCREVLRVMRGYRGTWCVESFDPRLLFWFRVHAPGVRRGQLGFGRGSETAARFSPFRARAMESLLMNVLSRPDFLSWDASSARFPPKAWRGPVAAWTVKSEGRLKALRDRCALQIFEGFTPGR